MSTTPQTGLAAASRSMGVKLILVGGLALAMTIPALLVYELIADRKSRAEEVTTEIGSAVGGAQTFLGPVLVVPYWAAAAKDPAANRQLPPQLSKLLIFPSQADASVQVKTEVRHRSLFKVPLYQADLRMKSTFDLTSAAEVLPTGSDTDWEHAYFLTGASDGRGALEEATLRIGGETVQLEPEGNVFVDPKGKDYVKTNMSLFSHSAALTGRPASTFEVQANMKFSGASRLAVLPYGRSTRLAVTGDWPNPSFDGGFLPVSRHITGKTFSAQWSVPMIARGVPAQGDFQILSDLARAEMGVTFLVVADPYQSVSRSVKYATLFFVFVFLTYFLLEISTGRRIHPAQYILVGVAQIVFYLLLLALTERIGFDAGFAVAATATVMLIALYARWVFESSTVGLKALAAFSAIYGMIFLLLRLEDEALLLGSIASFVVIAVTMYATRKLNWYSGLEKGTTPPA